VKTSDIEASQLLTAKLEEFINWLEKFPSTVAIKQAAEARKWMCANLAVPLSGRAQEDLVQFQDWFKRWLPETLQQCAGVAAVRR